MKTTVVPAQITTVEDRIAGNLTFPQIVLMILPLLTSTAVYACVPQFMHFSALKIVLMALQFIFFDGLAIRFRGKIVADWLVIYLRFAMRPRRYIFTKNDVVARDIEIAVQREPQAPHKQKSGARKTERKSFLEFDKRKAGQMLNNPGLTVSFKFAKKGGLDVSLKPIKR